MVNCKNLFTAVEKKYAKEVKPYGDKCKENEVYVNVVNDILGGELGKDIFDKALKRLKDDLFFFGDIKEEDFKKYAKDSVLLCAIGRFIKQYGLRKLMNLYKHSEELSELERAERLKELKEKLIKFAQICIGGEEDRLGLLPRESAVYEKLYEEIRPLLSVNPQMQNILNSVLKVSLNKEVLETPSEFGQVLKENPKLRKLLMISYAEKFNSVIRSLCSERTFILYVNEAVAHAVETPNTQCLVDYLMRYIYASKDSQKIKSCIIYDGKDWFNAGKELSRYLCIKYCSVDYEIDILVGILTQSLLSGIVRSGEGYKAEHFSRVSRFGAEETLRILEKLFCLFYGYDEKVTNELAKAINTVKQITEKETGEQIKTVVDKINNLNDAIKECNEKCGVKPVKAIYEELRNIIERGFTNRRIAEEAIASKLSQILRAEAQLLSDKLSISERFILVCIFNKIRSYLLNAVRDYLKGIENPEIKKIIEDKINEIATKASKKIYEIAERLYGVNTEEVSSNQLKLLERQYAPTFKILASSFCHQLITLQIRHNAGRLFLMLFNKGVFYIKQFVDRLRAKGGIVHPTIILDMYSAVANTIFNEMRNESNPLLIHQKAKQALEYEFSFAGGYDEKFYSEDKLNQLLIEPDLNQRSIIARRRASTFQGIYSVNITLKAIEDKIVEVIAQRNNATKSDVIATSIQLLGSYLFSPMITSTGNVAKTMIQIKKLALEGDYQVKKQLKDRWIKLYNCAYTFYKCSECGSLEDVRKLIETLNEKGSERIEKRVEGYLDCLVDCGKLLCNVLFKASPSLCTHIKILSEKQPVQPLKEIAFLLKRYHKEGVDSLAESNVTINVTLGYSEYLIVKTLNELITNEKTAELFPVRKDLKSIYRIAINFASLAYVKSVFGYNPVTLSEKCKISEDALKGIADLYLSLLQQETLITMPTKIIGEIGDAISYLTEFSNPTPEEIKLILDMYTGNFVGKTKKEQVKKLLASLLEKIDEAIQKAKESQFTHAVNLLLKLKTLIENKARGLK